MRNEPIQKLNFQLPTQPNPQYAAKHSITLSHPTNPAIAFAALNVIPKDVVLNLESRFSEPTPIQAIGWPTAFSGKDLVGVAMTGSGKTLSYALPMLKHASLNRGLSCLCLAPTRELVCQISEVVVSFERSFGTRSVAVYGGVPAYNQKNALRSGSNVIIATPGRLIDLYKQGCFDLQDISFVVIDEADRMLDMGFEPQLREILQKTNKDRQTLMWSATWPKEVQSLAASFLRNEVKLTVGSEDLTANRFIQQKVVVCEDREKRDILKDILTKGVSNYLSARGSNPRTGDAHRDYRNDRSDGYRNDNRDGDSYRDNRSVDDKIIVFCNTKRMCDNLEYTLQRSQSIHGDKSQAQRDRAINAFKTGRISTLIATDVAARGLDIKDVKCVINFDFPKNIEDYVHRIGRTARGNTKTGIAISLVTSSDTNTRELVRMLQDAECEVPRELRELIPRRVQSSRAGSFSRYRRWN